MIVLWDQDDVWNAQKIATLEQVLARDPEAMYAFSDAEMIDESGSSSGAKLWDAVGLRHRLNRFVGPGQLEILLRHNLVPGASIAFRSPP